MKITPVILCGGSGTRLWPLSRHHYPKQFLKLVGDTTLFQESINRLVALQNGNIKISEILIVTNEDHRFLVLEQIERLKLNVSISILLEPEQKNTAPALTLAAFAANEKNPKSILLVTPADHYVKDSGAFIQSMQKAISAVEKQTIVTLGIEPTRPDSGFGYIEYEGEADVKNVLHFKEKPSLEQAKTFIGIGHHAWNSGMFVLESKTWLDAVDLCDKKMKNAIQAAWRAKVSDQWFTRPDVNFFCTSPSNSIDYAVMENAQNINVKVKLVLLDAGWSDLGSYDALDQVMDKDSLQNITQGDVVSINSRNNIAFSTKKHISLLGVENLIVIETADAVLVANKEDAQSIKKLVNTLEENHSFLLDNHTKVNRPWGWFETIDQGENFKVKQIVVSPHSKLSYQSHKYRNEHWIVVKGRATIIQDDKEFILEHDESTYIKKNVKHQLINNEKTNLKIIEVQTGEKTSEEDIVRFRDIYGRN